MGGHRSCTPNLEAGPPMPALWPRGSPETWRCWGPCGWHTQRLAGMLREWGGPAHAVFGPQGPCVQRGAWGPQRRVVGPGPGALVPPPPRGAWTGQQHAALTQLGRPSPGAGQPPVQGVCRGGGSGGPGRSPQGVDPGPAVFTAASLDFPPVSPGCSWGHQTARHTGPPIPPDPGWAHAGLPAPFCSWHPQVMPAVQPRARRRAMSSEAQAASSTCLPPRGFSNPGPGPRRPSGAQGGR